MGIINTVAHWYKVLKISHSDNDLIAGIQQRQLRKLLRYAVANSEFYQDLYKGIDLDACLLSDLPTVTKAVMMDNYNRFVTDKRLKLKDLQSWVNDRRNAGRYYLGEFIPFLTSGSTGQNALISYHRDAVEVVKATLFASYPFQANRSINGHIKTTVGYLVGRKPRVAAVLVPGGNIHQFYARIPTYHRFFMDLKFFSVLDPLDRNIEELNKFQPDQIMTNSFFIALLAQEQLAGRLQIGFKHPMSYIAGFGEVLTGHTRELATKAWNMIAQDSYGAMECYLMATSCQKHGNLHQMSHLGIIEIVDRNCNPVPPGQYGEKILLTNLFNITQPLIRYEIEDIVGFADHNCSCGSPLPTLLPVQGRAKDFFYFKKADGGYEKFLPNLLIIPLNYMQEIRQFQFVQTDRNELSVNYVLQRRTPDMERKLEQTITKVLAQKGLENHVTLKFHRVETIARDERSGKYKPVISLGPPSNLDTP
jgi:phenylacetate-coenzyme A ligase PaaK-like adenylate-forming protein